MTAADIFVPPSVATPPRPLPYWRAIRTFLDNPIEAWPRDIYEQPFWSPPRSPRFLYVCNPDAIGEILLHQAQRFDKGALFRRMLSPALGEAMLTAEGAHWRWQRQAAAPAFRHERIAAMVPLMSRAAEGALDRWRAAGDGARTDVAADMVRTTFDVILDAMLSGGEGFDVAEASRAIEIYFATLGKPNILDFFDAPTWLRNFFQPRGMQATRYLREMVGELVVRRRAGESRGDLQDMLLASTDPETGRAMSDVDVRDNLLTFIGAGHETTALALTWALYLVGRHGETERRILAEVEAVAGDATITAEHVGRLVFTRQVVLEAMRLYPPVAVLPRHCHETTMVGDRRIEKGTIILIPIYALHRHRSLWENPDGFDPDRFAPEKGLEKRRFAYMPFGAGQRICIGMQFALMEATAILATLVRGAHVTPDPDHRIRPLVRITMRPEGGMPMTVTPR